MGANDYLLPKVARQRFVGRDGAGAENTITFSACREYQAESNLDFGARSPAAADRAGVPAAFALSPGLPVTVELTTAIRSDQAAAGDRIEGRLAKPIRDEKQRQTLVPEGAAVHGRLMRVETHYAPALQVTLVFRWETVEIDGVNRPLSLIPNRRTADLNVPTRGALRQRGVVLELPAPGEGRYATLRFPGDQATLPIGNLSEWLSAKPE